VKQGTRALGIAESATQSTSYLAGTVVKASRAVDGFVFQPCTVGESDATEAICSMVDRLDREDVRYLLVAGSAPAWFNILDLRTIHDRTGLPTLSVTFEESAGLDEAIREAFDDPDTVADRLATYHAQPDRHPVTVNGETVFVRAVGIEPDESAAVVQAFTPTGGRPEPLRVARLAARAVADTPDRRP